MIRVHKKGCQTTDIAEKLGVRTGPAVWHAPGGRIVLSRQRTGPQVAMQHDCLRCQGRPVFVRTSFQATVAKLYCRPWATALVPAWVWYGRQVTAVLFHGRAAIPGMSAGTL
jgi:hypothetical protein